ncbi:MAG: GNAT family N-acetyltransferase [Patescibacteria group bacterium]
MNTIAIRKGVEKDIPTYIRLQKNDGFPHQYYLIPKRVKQLFDRGEQFFIASIDQIPVGFSSVDFEIRAQAHFLCVDKRFTRKGVGSMLMNALVHEAKARGYTHMSSYVEADSLKEFFLKKHGFVQVGYYKNRYGTGKDATIWEVDLSLIKEK